MRAPSPPRNSYRSSPRVGAWGAVALALAACAPEAPPPALSGVSPEWGYNGESTEVAIAGAHFFPTVVVSGSEEAGGRIEGTFAAWLLVEGQQVPLEDVRHAAYDSLVAEVPPGLAPGLYDLRVQVPSGAETTLADAFTVTDTRADHLDLYVNDASYIVGSYAALTITLQDPTERTVPQAMEVEVRAVAASDASTASNVRFYEEGLDGQTALDAGVGVRGRLEEDGTGVVLVTSDVPSDLRLEVVPVEDSFVRGDEQVLSWEPGPVDTVELVLPRSPFRTLAGSTFDLGIRLLDAYGNVLEDEPAALLLWDDCGNEVTPFVEIVGEGTVPLTLTAACPSDVLSAFAYDTVWATEPFEILPGPVTGYDVQAAPTSIVAGNDVLVFVEAVDDFGNLVADHAGGIDLYDDQGGLDPDLFVGEQLCPGFVDGAQVCTAAPWAAASEVVLTAVDDLGRTGVAAPIAVLPGSVSSIQVLLSEFSVAAGESFEVVVRAVDAFGNAVAFDPGGSNPVAFDDATGTVGCTWTGPSGGGQVFDCTIEAAVDDAVVEATVLGLTGTARDTLEVTNGPLALVEVDPQGASFTAGVSFTLELRGYDTYGNAYVEQTDPVVDLADSAGALSPATAVFGPAGTAQISATTYAAGTLRLTASQDGVLLGTSRALVVAPGALDALDVEAPAWASVDEPVTVVVTAVDAYGNAVEGYAGPATLSARGDGCGTVVLDTFEGGVATATLACDAPTLSETLLAVDDEGYGGESEVFDVVDLACAAGPAASLAFDGDPYALACLPDGGDVDVTADTSGSVAGDAALVVRHFDDGETAVRTLSATSTRTYDAAGVRRVEALVVDADACAALAEGYVYVGTDDGAPTGPVVVQPSVASVVTGGSVSVDVAATDCTGDVASGESLLVRADLGSPGGSATGSGLSLTLDGAGEKSFTWVFDTGYAGTATIVVGSADGGAIGTASVTATDDAALPEVVRVDPSGVTTGTVSAIEVLFTEPMLERNVGVAQVPLTGPGGSISATYTLSADLRTLTIVPDTPIDADAGAYAVTFTTGVRDTAGNQIDGAWADTPASLTVPFGAVADALPALTACATDTDTFTPDGDDGADADADTVGLTPTAAGAPTWWWLRVTDADGAHVRSVRQPGTDTRVAWDGRGDDGRVAEPGAYVLSLRAIDTYGNIGDTCDATVQLEQRVALP